MRSLGADRVLDHTREDVARTSRRFAAVFGVNGHLPLSAYRALLTPGGVYVMVGGDPRQLFEAIVLGKARFLGTGRRVEVLTIDERQRAADLAELRTRLARGELRPVIDRVWPLAQIADAMRYVERGHVLGKVVLDATAFRDACPAPAPASAAPPPDAELSPRS